MGNFHDGYLETGGVLGKVRKEVMLIADDTNVNVVGITYLALSSDNTTAANRTFTLTPGDKLGHELTIVFQSAGATTAQLADSGINKLSAAWEPTQYDSLRLMWDGTYWVELSRADN